MSSEQKVHEIEELLTNSFHIDGMLCEMQIPRSNCSTIQCVNRTTKFVAEAIYVEEFLRIKGKKLIILYVFHKELFAVLNNMKFYRWEIFYLGNKKGKRQNLSFRVDF